MFPGKPIPDDLRVRLHFEQFFDCVKAFPEFPNVMTMVGDGWPYWRGLAELPENNWTRQRIDKAIRVTMPQEPLASTPSPNCLCTKSSSMERAAYC